MNMNGLGFNDDDMSQSPTFKFDIDGRVVDFSSFWSHYRIVNDWINIGNETRLDVYRQFNEFAMNEEQQTICEVNKNVVVDKDDEISAEMLAFYRTTFEHRKQRDKMRLEQANELVSNETSNYEYCKAGQSQKLSPLDEDERKAVMRVLYGEEHLAKLEEMQSAIQNKYNEEFEKNKPQTWPNIPMRF